MATIPQSIHSNASAASAPLTLESTLQMLPQHASLMESCCSGKAAFQLFDRDPLLPGLILTNQGQFVGMISRRRFMEQMSRPYGLDLFLKRSLDVLYPFVSTETLALDQETLIVSAVHQSLQRSPELLYEPIVVRLASQQYSLIDVHELLVTYAQIHELARQLLNEQTQAQLIQTEKMALLGRTIASVAHEILNPVNFISGNLNYLSNHIQDLFRILSTYDAAISKPIAQVEQVKSDVDFKFLHQDLPLLVDSLKLGSDRLKGIAESLRNFSHMDESKRKLADVHECIDNTLLILNSRLRYNIQVVKHYGDLLPLNCYSGQLSQVFMNIISNAIDALNEKYAKSPLATASLDNSPSQDAQIEITTEMRQVAIGELVSDWVSVRIADNGTGIPPEIQQRIFETFFTTKPVGQGTGLGLAISHQIVTEKHGGKLNLASTLGVGTEFEILLPLH